MFEFVIRFKAVFALVSVAALQLTWVALAVRVWQKRNVLKKAEEYGLHKLVLFLSTWTAAAYLVFDIQIASWLLGRELDGGLFQFLPRLGWIKHVYLLLVFVLLGFAFEKPRTQACPEAFTFRLLTAVCTFIAWFVMNMHK
jgi:hypothetical protein